MGQGAGKEADDPSMEDILASIRRILNDDEPGEAAHEASAGAEHGTTPPPEPAQDDVFVLDQSMRVAEPAPQPQAAEQPAGPAPVSASPAPAAKAEPETTTPPQQATAAPMTPTPTTALLKDDPDEALIAPSTAAAASASMGALVRVIGQQQTPVYRGGPTLEDMVRDELRPMVKSWLDEHLAPMVERMVRAEIARVTEGK